MSKRLFKPGIKVQVGQKSCALQDDGITTMSWYVYMQYHTTLKIMYKCDNKMKKVTLKTDNMHFSANYKHEIAEILRKKKKASKAK